VLKKSVDYGNGRILAGKAHKSSRMLMWRKEKTKFERKCNDQGMGPVATASACKVVKGNNFIFFEVA
jgi:hypothetical protein